MLPFRERGDRRAPKVGAARAFGHRPDAVFPVVAVGKAAAGPADHGRLDLLQRVGQSFADTVGIGDLGIGADPDAVVDHPAEVFGEVAVDLRRDGAEGFVEHDVDSGVEGGRGAKGRLWQHRSRSQRKRRVLEELAARQHRSMRGSVRGHRGRSVEMFGL